MNFVLANFMVGQLGNEEISEKDKKVLNYHKCDLNSGVKKTLIVKVRIKLFKFFSQIINLVQLLPKLIQFYFPSMKNMKI